MLIKRNEIYRTKITQISYTAKENQKAANNINPIKNEKYHLEIFYVRSC